VWFGVLVCVHVSPVYCKGSICILGSRYRHGTLIDRARLWRLSLPSLMLGQRRASLYRETERQKERQVSLA